MHFLEIACFKKEAALAAAAAGAHRLELCSHKELGGVSPDLAWVKEVKETVNIPVYLMIRPRGGNFIYTEEELQLMAVYLKEANKLHIDGFVFGCLNTSLSLNLKQNKYLINLAGGKPCTLHKAFDEIIDPFKALEEAIALGFSAILSSGKELSALAGLPLISKLIVKAEGRIEIMPGGNIRSSNLAHIKKNCGATWFHSAALLANETMPEEIEIKALLNT
jgi:copper homeostasis protein